MVPIPFNSKFEGYPSSAIMTLQQKKKKEKGRPFTAIVMNYYSFNFIMSFLYERASTPNHEMTVDVKYAQDN